MCRLFNFAACFCWISVSVLLHRSTAFVSNISTPNQLPNVTAVQDQEDTDWDSQLLQLRASLPSYSRPIRPYALLTHTEDYHYMPTPRQSRSSRLLRLLGSSFDPFWMSIDQPSEGSQRLLHGDAPLVKLANDTAVKETFNLSSSPDVREAAANYRQKLEKEAAALDLGSLPSDVASSVRGWLVRSATCELHHQWVDVGPTFWPRWLRQTDCEKSDEEGSCSFPSGMKCVRAQTTHIQILAWHCLEVRDRGDVSRRFKGERSDGSTEVGTGEAMKRCLWRQMPYPVVTACMCSCK